jgi:transposase
MPKKATNRYTPQFRAKAVQLAQESGRPIGEVARDLGVPNQTLYGWLAKAKPGSPSPVATGVVETPEEEARRLRRELADVTQERDFLKKAAAFFAKLNT